ncbi:Hypothetical_protein [Hexamita inflata]|uniref:Hypothetical_protein n=1 Tax=Hexamita inflata TaxID=28002 RepID=A0AA86NGU2_9EUKA|nr:Hypothetical protein HINF_LOCUS6718 [Hexamita inflata]
MSQVELYTFVKENEINRNKVVWKRLYELIPERSPKQIRDYYGKTLQKILYSQQLTVYDKMNIQEINNIMNQIWAEETHAYIVQKFMQISEKQGYFQVKATIVSDLIGFLLFQSFISIKSTIKRRLIIYNFEATCILQTYKLKIKQPLQLRHSTTFDKNSTSIQYLHGYQSQTNDQIYNRFDRRSSYILNFNRLLVGFKTFNIILSYTSPT